MLNVLRTSFDTFERNRRTHNEIECRLGTILAGLRHKEIMKLYYAINWNTNRSLDRTFTFKGKLTPFETVARTISSRNVIAKTSLTNGQFPFSRNRKAKRLGIGRSPCFFVARHKEAHKEWLSWTLCFAWFYPKGQGRFLWDSSSYDDQCVNPGVTVS